MDATFYAVWFDGGPNDPDKVTPSWQVAKDWFDQTGKASVFAFNPVEGWSRDVTDEFADDHEPEATGPDNSAYRRDMIAAGRRHLLGDV